jgi:hypothetical protein
MSILNWKKFNENEYTKLATKLMGNMHKNYAFTEPQDNFQIKYCTIQFPDDTIINFDCQEFHNKDIGTFKLSLKRGENNSTNWKGAQSYLNLYGNEIQFDDYNEYKMIRYYMNREDLFDTTFDGYIYGDGKLGATDVRITIDKSNVSLDEPSIFLKSGLISNPLSRNLILDKAFLSIKGKPAWRNFFYDHKDETLQNFIDPIDTLSIETNNKINPFEINYNGINLCGYIYLYQIIYGFKDKLEDVKFILNNINMYMDTEKILGVLYEMI